MNSRKLSKYIVASALATAVAVGGGVTMAEANNKDVHLDIDGKIAVVSTDAETVEEVLEEVNVDASEELLIVPSSSSSVSDNMEVKVRSYKPVTIVEDGIKTTASLPAATVEEALASAEIPHNKTTAIEPALAEEIDADGAKIVVSNVKKIQLINGGKKENVSTNAATVAQVLEDNGVSVGPEDELNTNETAYTKPGMTINLVQVSTEQKTVKVKEEVVTKVKEDPSLLEGETKVEQKGSPPIVHRIVSITYANGKVRDRKIVREVTVSRGSQRVVLRGTKPKPAPSSKVPGASCGGWQPLLDKHFGGQSGKACAVMMCESGGNPQAQNPRSSASGLFQFIDGSWRSAATAVPGASKYARAYQAPPEMQIEAAAKWLARTSWSQWVCA